MPCVDVIEKLHVGPGDLIIVKTNSSAAVAHALTKLTERGFNHPVIVMTPESSIDKMDVGLARIILERIIKNGGP